MSVTPPTEDDLKQLVITTAGDYNGVVAANIDLLWSIYAGYASSPPLQFLYTLRASLDLLAGQVWQQVDAAVDDARESLSDMYKALKDRIALVNQDIEYAANAALVSGGGLVVFGQLTTTAPTSPPYWWLDANDPRYIGSVYSVYTSYGWAR